MINLILVGINFLGIAYLGGCLFLLIAQNRFIFFPKREINTTPQDYQFKYEDVWLSVETRGKEERIHGWWIPANSNDFREEFPVLLYLHGNGSHIGCHLKNVVNFHQLGLSVFLIDYRGYGYSSDRFPSESSVYQDGERALNYLIQERGIKREKIFVYGHSLGGAIGIHTASQVEKLGGLIIEGSFTSMREMIDYLGYYWMFPINLLLHQRFNSADKIPKIKTPLLFIHGTEDEVVPAQMSEKLYQLAAEPKQLYKIVGAGHNNLTEVAGHTYQKIIKDFLEWVESQ